MEESGNLENNARGSTPNISHVTDQTTSLSDKLNADDSGKYQDLLLRSLKGPSTREDYLFAKRRQYQYRHRDGELLVLGNRT